MTVRDRLPPHGAGAVNLPDPQTKEPAVITHCAYCGATLYSGDEAVCDESGELFCDEACYFDWLIREGLAPLSQHQSRFRPARCSSRPMATSL